MLSMKDQTLVLLALSFKDRSNNAALTIEPLAICRNL